MSPGNPDIIRIRLVRKELHTRQEALCYRVDAAAPTDVCRFATQDASRVKQA